MTMVHSDSRGPHVGRREHRKLTTRAQILHAGRVLFSERGLHLSRIEDLTGRAGIAKGTLYLYYRNKEELIVAVVAEGYDLLAQRLDARLRELPPERTLEGLISGHLDFFVENPDLLRIFHQARGMLKLDLPEWKPLKRPLEQHLVRLCGWLARLPALSRASTTRRRSVALGMLGALVGITSLSLSLRPRRSLRAARPWLEPLLLRAATAMVTQR